MGIRLAYLVALLAWIGMLWWGLDFAAQQKASPAAVPTVEMEWAPFFAANILPSLPIAEEFDTPLRPPDGAGAVISLPFMEEGHLGEDWTTARGDAALGEPVDSVADGWVSVAQDFQNAWGKVILVCYRLPAGRWPPFVEVMYAQLNTIEVTPGSFVKRGQKIGTVGNAGGTYQAHLHWEVRQTVGLGLGPGFQAGAAGWLAPSDFITAHRGPRAQQPLLPTTLDKAQRGGWGTDF